MFFFSPDNRASLSATSVWGRESTHPHLPPVWFGSSPSILSLHSSFMFVCHFACFHGYYTHTHTQMWALFHLKKMDEPHRPLTSVKDTYWGTKFIFCINNNTCKTLPLASLCLKNKTDFYKCNKSGAKYFLTFFTTKIKLISISNLSTSQVSELVRGEVSKVTHIRPGFVKVDFDSFS